ncbi:MAG: V-type ATP synthase subunit D [Candidatus Algichlamydia australiensis]|nr:V-type ATP synthase subunit D [Chlamydiales bacterium]
MIRLTKNELRDQQLKKTQLSRYLPTLQLKKALLQAEVNQATLEIDHLKELEKREEQLVTEFHKLLSAPNIAPLLDACKILNVQKGKENIAGVDIPTYKSIEFAPVEYPLISTPLWWDNALEQLRATLIAKEKIRIAKEKKHLLEKELREVSIRVNLFEKILIPRAEQNIRKIKVFLGDQELAAVSQAKAAKRKIYLRGGR